MTSFDDIKQNPNHPFWDFVAQLDGDNNNENKASSSRAAREASSYSADVSSSLPLPHRELPHREHEHGGPGGRPRGGPHGPDGEAEEEPMTPPPPPPFPGDGPRGPHHGGRHHPHHHHHHEHQHHRGGPHGGPRGRGGPRGGGFGRGGRGPFPGHGMPPPPFGGPGGVPFNLPALAGWIQNTFIEPRGPGRDTQHDAQDFTPAIDVFSTDAAFLVHMSLPGALKQDIAVNWSAETTSLIVSGVITRPGVENLVRITGERQVGAFERKIPLWSGDESVRVDENGISAKLEDGVLKVVVPKLTADEGFVEVKRVDID